MNCWRQILAAGFPGLVALYLGLSLFLGNRTELAQGRADLAVLALGCLGLWGVLFAVLRWLGALGKLVWAIPAAYAAFILVREVAFPLPLGEINGVDACTGPSTRYVLLETLTLLAALAAFLVARPRRSARVAGVFTVVFAVSILALAARHARELGLVANRHRPHEPVPLAIPAPNRPMPNVYHILFDEYQTVEHRFVRQERGVAPFDDFICFENNIANYNHTWLSFASFFTGAEYAPGQDVWQWFRAFPKEGLIWTLKQHGYQVRLYGQSPAWYQTPHADLVRCSDPLAQEMTRDRAGGQLATLLQLRLSPSALAARLPVAAGESNADGPQLGDWPYFSMMLYREMVAGIEKTPPHGNYTFIHLILPHGPFVLDEQGNYLGTGKGSRMQGVYLIDRLVAELTAELKRLGRYDDSLIVVHADTGSYYLPRLEGQRVVDGHLRKPVHKMKHPDWQDGTRWVPAIVEARINAALLIKPPHHQGSRIDPAPSQLLDLVPTILGAVGLNGPESLYLHGCDLLHQPPPPDRARKTFVLGKKIGGVQAPLLQEWLIRDGHLERGAVLPVTGLAERRGP